MKRLLHPLLLLLARATENELVLYIEYLKAENRILRGKLPKRVNVTPAERAKLVKLGVNQYPAALGFVPVFAYPVIFVPSLLEIPTKATSRPGGPTLMA